MQAVDAGLARFGGSDCPVCSTSRRPAPPPAATTPPGSPTTTATCRGCGRWSRAGGTTSRCALRWILAALGALRDMPREEVLELIGPAGQQLERRAATVARARLIGQAALGALLVDA